tara:strand:+ start:923 stop:1168 length:246 start_codon:yes stop_codon:yes gene_type:complete
MFKKMLRKFLGIDELENQLTQIDKELQDNIEETECQRTDLDDRPSFYDMESQVESLVSDWVNDALEDIVERLKKLEDKNES